MSVRVELIDASDAARVVDALLEQADACEAGLPLLARRYRAIADAFGDALDELPVPSDVGARKPARKYTAV